MREIGLVPTMGNLHSGHESLIKRSFQSNPCVIVSIFVNPTQFAPGEDFEVYPRTLERDLEVLKKLLAQEGEGKALYVFAPSKEEVYHRNFKTFIEVEGISEVLEGRERPKHFKGVATVVFLLQRLLQTGTIYLGQKDYQQYLIIKKMFHDLLIPVQVVLCPTVRDPSGLALSSRNQYLNFQEKREALKLNRTLLELKNFISMSVSPPPIEKIRNKISRYQDEDPRWNYLTLCNVEGLQEWTTNLTLRDDYVLLGAYQLGKTRLIDNLLVRKALC